MPTPSSGEDVARQPGAARAVFGGAAAVHRDSRRSGRAPTACRACTWASRRTKWSSSGSTGGRLRSCSSSSASGPMPGGRTCRRNVAGRVPVGPRVSGSLCAGRARCAVRRRRPVAARGAGDHDRPCPRSNRYVGAGDPPLEAFYAMDVDVAFGTDSLASVADLNLFAELQAARRLAPRVPARAAARERDAGRARVRSVSATSSGASKQGSARR